MRYANLFFSIIGVMAIISVCAGQFQPNSGDLAALAAATCGNNKTEADCKASNEKCTWSSGKCAPILPINPAMDGKGGVGQACYYSLQTFLTTMNATLEGDKSQKKYDILTLPNYSNVTIDHKYQTTVYSCDPGNLAWVQIEADTITLEEKTYDITIATGCKCSPGLDDAGDYTSGSGDVCIRKYGQGLGSEGTSIGCASGFSCSVPDGNYQDDEYILGVCKSS